MGIMLKLVLIAQQGKIGAQPGMDPATNFWWGCAVPRDKILMPRPAITAFLSGFHGKTAQKARRR